MDQSGFRTLVENAPDAIVVSRDGTVLYANRAAARLLGHDDVSELVGKPLAARFVFICGGTYAARARDQLERVSNPRLDKPFRVAQLVDAIERVASAGGTPG